MFQKFQDLALNSILGKIATLTVVISVVCCASVGVLNYLTSRSALIDASKTGMNALINSRDILVKSQLDTIEKELKIYSTNDVTIKAFEEMTTAVLDMKDELPKVRSFFQQKELSRDERIQLSGKGNKTFYSWKHEKIHDHYSKLVTVNGIADIYLVSPKGFVLYSVTKSNEFLHDLTKVNASSSGLKQAFQMISKTSAQKAYVPFGNYEFESNKPSAFLGLKVTKDFLGTKTDMGYIVFRLSDETFKTAVTSGLDATKDATVLLVDEKLKPIVASQKIASLSEILAQIDVKKKKAFHVTDGLDTTNYISYTTFDFFGQKWSLLAMKTENQVLGAVYQMRNATLMVTCMTLAIMFFAGLWFARSLSRPIENLVCSMNDLARGELSIDLKDADRTDEIGDMYRAVSIFRDNELERVELVQTNDAEQKRREKQQEKINSLIEHFKVSIKSVLDSVTGALTSMNGNATELNTIALDASEKITEVEASSQDSSKNVQSVSQQTEELVLAIREISEHSTKASSVISTAMDRATETSKTMSDLDAASKKIGEVVTLIRDIAEQTNLLALNATIEAARAGENGKGFAVVAGEVKSLSDQTSKATEEISKQILSIQGYSTSSVNAIASITETMEQIHSVSNSIACAVEEQDAVTLQISNNIEGVAQGAVEINSNMETVTRAVEQTSDCSDTMFKASDGVTRDVEELSRVVDEFLEGVAAA